MSKTTVIDVQFHDQIKIDNQRELDGDICIELDEGYDTKIVYLNREQTKQFIEHLQSTLEDE